MSDEQKNHIFFVEDDDAIAAITAEHLQRYGYEVMRCGNYTNLLDEFHEAHPDIVLMDINLPAYDGFFWCGKIRMESTCPILFISSRTADSDQVHAMEKGGDDFITKPFSLEVLTAKINAQLRRAYGQYAAIERDDIPCEDCSFSISRMTLSCGDRQCSLTKTEAGVIRLLFREYPGVAERSNIMESIWDDETFVEENTLNVTISRLRKKLAEIGSCLTMKPVRGVGYQVVKSDEKA